MKKILLLSLLMVGLVSFSAPRIILEDQKDHYVQTETGYNLQFKLVANGDEIQSIMAQVQNMSDRLSLQLSEGSNQTMDCVFVINHQNQPEYVHKMLVYIGIADLEYKGNVQPLETIIDILKSYL